MSQKRSFVYAKGSHRDSQAKYAAVSKPRNGQTITKISTASTARGDKNKNVMARMPTMMRVRMILIPRLWSLVSGAGHRYFMDAAHPRMSCSLVRLPIVQIAVALHLPLQTLGSVSQRLCLFSHDLNPRYCLTISYILGGSPETRITASTSPDGITGMIAGFMATHPFPLRDSRTTSRAVQTALRR